MIDPVEFGKAMGAIVREAVAPLLRRIEELEKRQPERGEQGPQGERGLDGERGPQGEKGDPGDRGEKGERGEPGQDAPEVDVEAVVASVMKAMLGGDGLKTLVDLQVSEAVAGYFAENPIQHGRDGAAGAPGPQGERGEKGEAGQDGVGVADALIDRDGALVLTMSDGRAKSLGVVVGRDGAAGANGRDGLSMADVVREYDSERHEVVERWTAAGEAKELRYPAGGIRPGGFYREGMKCHALQAVTHDGALWIAKRDTTAKPCLENADDWQLAARKGRDGRDGKDGKPPPGPVALG
jgi:hypothetical protein